MELSQEQMVEYLKKLVELEASVYIQTQSNEIAHENLVYVEPKMGVVTIKEPVNEADKIEFPEIPNESTYGCFVRFGGVFFCNSCCYRYHFFCFIGLEFLFYIRRFWIRSIYSYVIV